MATSQPSANEPTEIDDRVEFGVGMAHPTIVPTNYDPERRERTD
ncbi:hypothetical protein [Natrarchaeobius halalkaliphilus]|nr:hypothetical protein [Natrarchaeobius halalkaliphilus]